MSARRGGPRREADRPAPAGGLRALASRLAVATAATVAVALGCVPAVARTAPGSGDAAAVAARSGERTCPSAEFATFLAAFSESPALQERSTRFPLRRRSLVDGDPEPRQVEVTLSRAGVSFPVFPSDAARGARGLKTRVEADGARRSVVVWKPDTDYQVRFVFEQHGCWQLVLIDDQSL